MTNKINGIDVSECEYINCCSRKAKCIILQDDILSDSQYCESEANCYFKQLKRLQEENKKLKNKNNDLIEIIASGNIDIAILQKENEGLKSLNDFNVQKIEVLQEENEELKQNWRLDCLKCEYKNTKADVDKYKQALEEIREIAQGMHDWWINKTPYTDVYELAEHLLGTELNRILGVLEDSEDVENE